MVIALDKAVAAWNRFEDWFTEDKAQSVVVTQAVSGIAFFELVSPWFALPFLLVAAGLTGLIFHPRCCHEPDEIMGNLSCFWRGVPMINFIFHWPRKKVQSIRTRLLTPPL